MSRQNVPLVFIKHPDRVRDSYDETIRQFIGLMISAEEEDVFLQEPPRSEMDLIASRTPERYGRLMMAAEASLSRGMPEQGPQLAEVIPLPSARGLSTQVA